MKRKLWQEIACAALAALAGALTMAFAAWSQSGPAIAPETQADLATLRAAYTRPTSVPVPPDNPLTPARVKLGARLFTEKQLSADGSRACATCHDPALAFTDGVAIGRGVPGVALDRHTPSIWNLAWSRAFFWDGRASSLEEQAKGPIENPKEMALPLAKAVERLAAEASYAPLFRDAFPDAPNITEANLLKAIASFERTLVSPLTRFDRWIAGDEQALTEQEVRGFLVFNGKARCASCHSGWNFTDHAFHDVGLPDKDLGRGPVIGLPRVNHAFKTPSLRELVWTAPYMHDGSLATLDDVLRHYDGGGVDRPTRSPDMPNAIGLDDSEREALLAFLETLSSEQPLKPLPVLAAAAEPAETAVKSSRVSQKNKAFSPASIIIARGETLSILNDDARPHNVRIHSAGLKLDSGLQEPGETTTIEMTAAGTFEAFCGIHPNMRLTIEVR